MTVTLWLITYTALAGGAVTALTASALELAVRAGGGGLVARHAPRSNPAHTRWGVAATHPPYAPRNAQHRIPRRRGLS